MNEAIQNALDNPNRTEQSKQSILSAVEHGDFEKAERLATSMATLLEDVDLC